MQVLNFYSTIFADELKRGRKTATIRLGDKSGKYRKNQLVLVTIGYQHSPRERIFEAVIDTVEVMKLADLSPRDIKHDNPEFRRHEELISFLEQIYGRSISPEEVVTVVRFSQISRHADRHDRGHEGLRRRTELGAPRRPAAARPTSHGLRWPDWQSSSQLPISLEEPPRLLYIWDDRWHSPLESARGVSPPGRGLRTTRDARSTL